MRVVIFGTGKYYHRIKEKIREDVEVVALIDNDSSKWGKWIDGVEVFSPVKLSEIKYDIIFLASLSYGEMRVQLSKMGIPGSRILDINYSGKICEYTPAEYYGIPQLPGKMGNILLFSHNLSMTGAPNVLFIAAGIMKKAGYCVVVVSREDGGLKERFLELGINVVIMRDTYYKNTEFRKLVDWADRILVNTIRLYHVIEEILDLNKKIIWWIHEVNGFEDIEDRLFDSINKRKGIFVYAVSPLVMKKLLQRTGADFKAEKLEFGLENYKVEAKENRQKIIFALIGTIVRHKGQDIFIRAVERLPQSCKDTAEFWIVGRGQLAAEDLERVDSCIKITGEIDIRKMPELYHRIDVVVCCSREEPMSVVVVEGCMNGKLVIVSDAAGIADYITDRSDGLLFRSEDVKQLAELMEWAIMHREQVRQIGNAAKGVYEKNFTLEIFERNLLELMGKENA